MIFLSHTYNDKPIVDNIARMLASKFGKDNIFYDSWSIQPGEGIIDKIDSALKSCEYFFFFVSKKSLQSDMVKVEWQNALYKSTKEKIKIIPVKIEDCMMPAVLLQTLYIDVFGQGLEVATRQIIDVVLNKNNYMPQQTYHNVRAYVNKEPSSLTIEFRAETYMEPHSKYLIVVNNSKDELTVKAIGENMYEEGFFDEITLNDGRKSAAISIGRQSATSPGFPFIVELLSKDSVEINFIDAMRITSRESYHSIPIIYITSDSKKQ